MKESSKVYEAVEDVKDVLLKRNVEAIASDRICVLCAEHIEEKIHPMSRHGIFAA